VQKYRPFLAKDDRVNFSRNLQICNANIRAALLYDLTGIHAGNATSLTFLIGGPMNASEPFTLGDVQTFSATV
jgi:hypothetical protein